MNIGFIAHNNKKELIENFCIAYKRILAKHQLYATESTGRRIEQATNLEVQKFLPGSIGGDIQFMQMIEDNLLDVVIFFFHPDYVFDVKPNIYEVMDKCDKYMIPLATNIATAEALILGLDQGDLEWREK